MTTIDTIKFSTKLTKEHIHNIMTAKGCQIDLDKYIVDSNNPYYSYRNLLKVRTENSEIPFLIIFLNGNPNSPYANNVFITFHINNFLCQRYKKAFIDENKLFEEFFTLLEELLILDEFWDSMLALTEIHVCKDIFMKYPVHHYLQVLRFNSYSGKYPAYSNGTISIYRLSDLKKYSKENVKPNRVGIIYDKGRKMEFREEDVGKYYIIRFEYIFKENIRRDVLDISRNNFRLSHLYKKNWIELFNQQFLQQYFKDISDETLETRQTKSMEKKYFEEDDILELFWSKRKLSKNKRKKRYEFNTHYRVNFKKYLRKEFGEDGVKGIDLYQELYEKVYEPEDEINNLIPNPYYMYKSSSV